LQIYLLLVIINFLLPSLSQKNKTPLTPLSSSSPFDKRVKIFEKRENLIEPPNGRGAGGREQKEQGALSERNVLRSYERGKNYSPL
jgi:hypothetical protein